MGRLKQTVALVGMMGAGKSSLGRRLAAKLGVVFRDADAEIEAAAGCSINDIFDRFGQAAFRDGERKVIARLLREPPHVLATGGGAFIDPDTRARIKEAALSVWIDVPENVLVSRVRRRDTRPLLRDSDPKDVIGRLLRERAPIYAEADLRIDSADGPHSTPVERILEALHKRGIFE